MVIIGEAKSAGSSFIFFASMGRTQPSIFAITTGSYGKMLFAFGCGVLTVLLRYFGAYPEGVSFAILIMNILSPYIEKMFVKRPFGKVGK